jgi:hypothetical protein
MSQLYLPVAHTEADLVLAGLIAERLDSAELHVAWTSQHGSGRPEIYAELRHPAPLWYDAVAFVFQAVRELWAVVVQRDAPRPISGPLADPEPAADETAA